VELLDRQPPFQWPKGVKKKEPFSGPENRYPFERNGDRAVLSEDSRNLLKEIENVFVKCKETCPIPIEDQPHIGHAVGTFKDMGNGDLARGINNHADNHREMTGWSRIWRDVQSWTLKTIVVLAIATIIGLLASGYFNRIAQETKRINTEVGK
jgi:hypothetical protein